MDDTKFRWIEEPAGIQAAHGNKVSPFFPAERCVETCTDGAKRTIRSLHAAHRGCLSQPRARGDLDDQAGLVSEFRRRRAGNYFQRLNRVDRNLVGKYFALLIGDWLAVHREGIFSVVPEAMEE